MSRIIDDVRYSVRTLSKSPGYTVIALVTLALALGANTAIFSVFYAVMLRPLPYNEPERIVSVLEAPPGGGRNGISTLNFLDWLHQNNCFEYLAAETGGSASLTGHGDPVEIGGAKVSAHFFDIYGLKAAMGRTFLDGEDTAGKDHVVVLSHALWQTQFGGDPAIVGKNIELDGEPHVVIGVLPAGTPFERDWMKMWRPLTFKPDNMTRDFHWFGAMARLKPGVTLEQARAQMDAIGRRIAHDFPASNKGWGVSIEPLTNMVTWPQLRQSLWVTLGAVGMVLLIACANLANLTLMRVVGREREIAIRVAIGAGRWAVARQFLVESLVLSLAGGALGVAVGELTMAGINHVMPSYSLPHEADVRLDGMVLLFAFGLSVLTGFVVGLLPALHAARPDVSAALKQGGSATAGSKPRVRHGLVVAEVALAFVLLAGAGLLLRSLDKLAHVDPGFDSTDVLTFGLPIGDDRYPDMTARLAYIEQVRETIAALPGVKDVAYTSALPMQGWGYGMPFQIADQEKIDVANRPACFFKMVSADYFHALGIRVTQGRSLARTDRHGTPPVVVINQAMVQRFFKGANPIGKRILVQEIVPNKTQLGPEIPWEVVGVVANEYVGGSDEKTEENPGMYVTEDQSPASYVAFAVRGANDTGLLREPIKAAIHHLAATQVIQEMKTLETIKKESLGDNRFRSMLLSGFALVALVLSAVGIYGVISYSVSQRTKEIGIRTALGAGRADVLRLILRHGMGLTILGLVLGVGGAFGFEKMLGSLLFGVGGRDPLTLAIVAGLLGLVAFLACYLPARRATKVDPVIALRSE
ncbi:MAG TPA: ABC transporter permease [Candidatus Didemnitutus sp.]|nr:ABC transporter permease [Candidatus Didemnitutus sp.]